MELFREKSQAWAPTKKGGCKKSTCPTFEEEIFFLIFTDHLVNYGAFRNVHFETNCKLQPLRNESCNVRAELQPFRNCHNCKKIRTKLLQS